MNPAKRELYCLRCNTRLKYSGRELFQLGEESMFSGLAARAFSESWCMDIYTCPNCGKLEFFDPDVTE